MASVAYAITTTAKVKALLGLTTVDAARDALLDTMVSGITDMIERYCGGRRFKATDYVEIRDTASSKTLTTLQYPVNTLTLLEYRSGVPSNITWTTYSPDAYLVKLKAGVIQFFSKFTPFPQAFRITYNAGYLIDWAFETDPTKHTLPADLTMVATEMVAKRYTTRLAQGIKSESTEGQSITYAAPGEIANDHRSTLDAYRANRIASF